MAFSSISFKWSSIPNPNDIISFKDSNTGLTYSLTYKSLRINSFETSSSLIVYPTDTFQNVYSQQFVRDLRLDYPSSSFIYSINTAIEGILTISIYTDGTFFVLLNNPSSVLITINNVLLSLNNLPTYTNQIIEKHYFQYLNLNGDYKTRLLTYDSVNKIFHLPEINEEFFITDVFINSVKCSYIRLSYDSIEMEAYINTINKQYKPNKYSFIPAYTVFTMSNLTPVISSSFTSTSIATPVNISSKMQDNPDYQFLSSLVTSPEHKFFGKLGTIEIYPLASQVVSLVGTKFSPSRQVLYYCTTSVIACTCTLNFDDAANTFVPAVGVKSVFQQISSATTFVTGFVAVCTPF